jgi:hypothetical protein
MVRVRQFSEQEWAAVSAVVAAQLGRAAALLDGELPPELVDDVAAAGLSLLPGAGELQPRCSCPDWADPCKHSAAVCYLVADLLDSDPFGLLLLRGRVRDEVLAELRRMRADGVAGTESGTSRAVAGRERGDDDMTARQAYSREVTEPPVVPLPVRRPGRPAVAALAPPAESGLERDALLALAADAARRAWELATGDGDGGLTLTAEEDVARRAAPLLGGDKLAELARRAGLPSRELARRALAWRAGGAGGLGVLLTAWQPEPDQLAEGRAALRACSEDGRRVHTRDNRLTQGGIQLRLGRDGLWYRFGRSFGGWDLVSGPSADPATLMDYRR